MTPVQLYEALAQPTAFPYPVDNVDVRHTHISVVYLAGPYVYKVKKRLNLGFLNFDTLEKRRHFCEEEIRLNRRLASAVYIGVVPITIDGSTAHFEGKSEPFEWAVKMLRLPDQATLRNRLEHNEVDDVLIVKLAHRLAQFHALAESGPHVAAFGSWDVVAGNARDNFKQTASHIGITISASVHTRLSALTEDRLNRLRSTIEARAADGWPRDSHGDLHLDHVYFFPEKAPPDDLVVIDCIEFNERFRFADPVADLAFLVMDFAFHGRRALGKRLVDAYFESTGDITGRSLVPFYTSYRAAVRGKVEGLELFEKEIPAEEHERARALAQAHWLLALAELEPDSQRPCLVLVGGLPGTGKSTLARGLCDMGSFHLLRSDVVRKQLAGVGSDQARPSSVDQGIYTPEWTQRTYAELSLRAEKMLFDGQRVIVDATFQEERQRQLFLALARRWHIPMVLLICRSAASVIRERLQNRRNDASDADWAVYCRAADRWEAPAVLTQQYVAYIETTGGPNEALADSRKHLQTLQIM